MRTRRAESLTVWITHHLYLQAKFGSSFKSPIPRGKKEQKNEEGIRNTHQQDTRSSYGYESWYFGEFSSVSHSLSICASLLSYPKPWAISHSFIGIPTTGLTGSLFFKTLNVPIKLLKAGTVQSCHTKICVDLVEVSVFENQGLEWSREDWYGWGTSSGKFWCAQVVLVVVIERGRYALLAVIYLLDPILDGQ